MSSANQSECDAVQLKLDDFVVPGQIPDLPSNVRSHVNQCDACAEHLADLILLRGMVSRYASEGWLSHDPVAQMAQISDHPPHDARTITGTAVTGRTHGTLNGEVLDMALLPVPVPRQDVRLGHDRSAHTRSKELVVRRKRAIVQASPMHIAVASVAVVAVAAVAFLGYRLVLRPSELPRHAVLAAKAGEALDAGNYEDVIALAHECIDGYEPTAVRLQQELVQSGRELPSGAVSPQLREDLFRNGPLNDVAVCSFYLGQAHRKLGNDADALKAYQAAGVFTFARVWDPRQEIFWEPAADADYWAKKLLENPATNEKSAPP